MKKIMIYSTVDQKGLKIHFFFLLSVTTENAGQIIDTFFSHPHVKDYFKGKFIAKLCFSTTFFN